MDPEANLSEQLATAREIIAAVGRDVPWSTETEYGGDSDKWGDEQDRSEYFEGVSEELGALASRLAELVLALDEWRRKGGFDPLTNAPLDHIRALVEYNWPDEQRDFEEEDERSEGPAYAEDGTRIWHVFEHMQIIDKWLSEVTQ